MSAGGICSDRHLSSTESGVDDEFVMVPGYDQFSDKLQPPPLTRELSASLCVGPTPAGVHTEDTHFGVPALTEEDVRQALFRECMHHATWKKAAVKKMHICSIETTAALHYILESFTETRNTSYVCEPYIGQSNGESGLSMPPQAWEVVCEPQTYFVDEVRHIEVPNTSNTVVCKNCDGQGHLHCFFCRGTGQDWCNICNGTGMRSGIPHPNQTLANPCAGPLGVRPYNFGNYSKPSVPVYLSPNPVNPYYGVRGSAVGIPPTEWCWFCKGIGSKPCGHCKGTTRQSCKKCAGSGELRTYVRLTVRFRNESSDFFYETSSIPSDLLKEGAGQVVLEDSRLRVLPLRNHPVSALNEQSKRLIAEQNQKCIGKCKILFQRQTLRAIPISTITYQFGSRCKQFWIYGEDKRVYIKKYPDKCCIL